MHLQPRTLLLARLLNVIVIRHLNVSALKGWEHVEQVGNKRQVQLAVPLDNVAWANKLCAVNLLSLGEHPLGPLLVVALPHSVKGEAEAGGVGMCQVHNKTKKKRQIKEKQETRTHGHTHGHTQTNKHAHRQTDTHTDKQTHTQTEKRCASAF